MMIVECKAVQIRPKTFIKSFFFTIQLWMITRGHGYFRALVVKQMVPEIKSKCHVLVRNNRAENTMQINNMLCE